MRFVETDLPGAFLLELEPAEDERGWFARTFDADEFAAHGLAHEVAQSSVSGNARAGTLRGLHWQAAPHAEAKLIRCARGAIFDVLADVRPDSPAFGRWVGYELRPGNGRMLYAPAGVAHGFQTLEDDTEVSYQMDVPYAPESARGVRWDDPDLAIAWPDPPAGERTISERDRGWPGLQEAVGARA